jgi:hypothetical protein
MCVCLCMWACELRYRQDEKKSSSSDDASESESELPSDDERERKNRAIAMNTKKKQATGFENNEISEVVHHRMASELHRGCKFNLCWTLRVVGQLRTDSIVA